MSTADMLALLALLETNERSNRPISDSDDANLALYYRMMLGNTEPLQDEHNEGEWLNNLVEPSVQYYGNPFGRIEQNARDRHPFKGWYFPIFLPSVIQFSKIYCYILIRMQLIFRPNDS